MTDGRITANLPSRDFDVTEVFYRRLGFGTRYRGDGWMALERDGMVVEFFPHPDLDPAQSWFSACMWLGDIDAMHAQWSAKGVATEGSELPRMAAHPFELGGDAPRMFTMHDPDGSLWRVLETGGRA